MTRLIIFILIVFAGSAFGQGAHYTYPFQVVCPEGVIVAGGSAIVTAEFEGGSTGNRYAPTYNWTVSAGTIVSGQGTSSITVEAVKEGSESITVTLERTFLEAHYPEVQRSASCTFGVVPLPKARMTDEFRTGGSNCEEGFARLDSFFVELNSNPMDTGLIVLYNDTRDTRAASRREKQLRNHFTFRRFDLARVRFIHGEARDKGTTQFWMVPIGADMPNIEEAAAGKSAVTTAATQPYLYAADYSDGVPGCFGNLYDVEEYAKVLRSEPNSTARIVISQTSQAKYRTKVREIVAELARYGIARRRIVTVYKYVRPNRLLELTELWIVPAKRAAGVGWTADDGTELIRRCPANVQSWLRAC
jgi:hypothetical protein